MARCPACGKHQKGPVVDDHVCNPPEERLKPLISEREMDVRADGTRLWYALEELVFVTVAPMLSGVDLATRRGKAREAFVEAVVGLDRAFRRDK